MQKLIGVKIYIINSKIMWMNCEYDICMISCTDHSGFQPTIWTCWFGFPRPLNIILESGKNKDGKVIFSDLWYFWVYGAYLTNCSHFIEKSCKKSWFKIKVTSAKICVFLMLGIIDSYSKVCSLFFCEI